MATYMGRPGEHKVVKGQLTELACQQGISRDHCDLFGRESFTQQLPEQLRGSGVNSEGLIITRLPAASASIKGTSVSVSG